MSVIRGFEKEHRYKYLTSSCLTRLVFAGYYTAYQVSSDSVTAQWLESWTELKVTGKTISQANATQPPTKKRT